MGLEMLMNMFGGLGIGSPAVPVRSDVPPEELYATQLSQLQEMGFFDTRENIQALIAIAGNVHAAVERLLGNPGQQIVIIVIILFNMTYIINRGPL
ncbi:ubiquitin domain-containing protein DSK2b-like isoform X1 [Camellia sinensis]|uniref:ubiquitin domain-containing protein DSK2b-like isoform X1 n=1 Tax=Camellia sinensis TaxID=4442 RepID=UPI001035BA96|nr:ubiquitin domain-containing protein DSK2b-like isoform X1 [Camellia sinensis]